MALSTTAEAFLFAMAQKMLVGGGFSGRMHAVLWYFVNTARGRFLVEAEELIQRASAFADVIGLLNSFGDVSLGENHRFAQLLTAGKLCGDG